MRGWRGMPADPVCEGFCRRRRCGGHLRRLRTNWRESLLKMDGNHILRVFIARVKKKDDSRPGRGSRRAVNCRSTCHFNHGSAGASPSRTQKRKFRSPGPKCRAALPIYVFHRNRSFPPRAAELRNTPAGTRARWFRRDRKISRTSCVDERYSDSTDARAASYDACCRGRRVGSFPGKRLAVRGDNFISALTAGHPPVRVAVLLTGCSVGQIFRPSLLRTADGATVVWRFCPCDGRKVCPTLQQNGFFVGSVCHDTHGRCGGFAGTAGQVPAV